jgi:general stress protein 26
MAKFAIASLILILAAKGIYNAVISAKVREGTRKRFNKKFCGCFTVQGFRDTYSAVLRNAHGDDTSFEALYAVLALQTIPHAVGFYKITHLQYVPIHVKWCFIKNKKEEKAMSDLKEKIYEVIKEPQLMGVATITEDNKPWVRYVMAWGLEDLTVMFTTFLQSRKVGQIKKNPEVHITCGVKDLESAQRFLQIQGKAEISTDKELRHQCWNDMLKAYFKGPDDPNYAIFIVKPYRIEYQTMQSMTPEVWCNLKN